MIRLGETCCHGCIIFQCYLKFCSSKKSSKGKRPGKGGNRFWKSVGLGFKTPREAIEGSIQLTLRSILSYGRHFISVFIGCSEFLVKSYA